MTAPGKRRSLAEAVGMVPDGATVIIGSTLPMALVREVVRQRKRGLHLVGHRGIALDLLVAAGCATAVETVAAAGKPSPALDLAIAAGEISVLERNPAVAMARLRAAAAGLPFAVTGSPITSSTDDPAIATITDPFTGAPYQLVRAIRADVALIHMPAAEATGAVQSPMPPRPGDTIDVMAALSARMAIVSVEQIVSSETMAASPVDVALRSDTVTCLVEAPYGAHPAALEGRYDADADSLSDYDAASRDPPALEAWLDRWVRSPADHWAYLDRVGSRCLLGVTRNRNRRA